MKKRKLGETLEVSSIGFGCMGLNYHRGPAKDRDEMISIVHAAIDLGVTMLDTAEVYGPFINEELVGDALVGRRDRTISRDTHRRRTVSGNVGTQDGDLTGSRASRFLFPIAKTP